MPPEEKPPQPRPKPPKPKPNASPKPKKPPRPLPQLEATTSSGGGGGVPYLPPDPFACANNCSDSCAFYHLCPPPPPSNPAARVHISSGRLPTPLIALSASLLAVSAVLLLALLLHRLARRRRRRRNTAALAAAVALHDVEGGQQVLPGEGEEVEVEEDGDEGGVHHVWYIRTKGLDERAIAAIAAVVYDAGDKKKSGGGKDDDGSCAVCLGEFRHGETLRLLPRCGHAFHRGCIDTWLRAHVNCPLCRAPVQVTSAAGGADPDTAAGDALERNINPHAGGGGGGGVRAEEAERGDGGAGVPAERGVRRAASMVALPRRGGAAWWPDASFRAPVSSSGREGDMAGIGKIMRLLKFSDSLEMAGVGAGAARSVSFSAAGSCQRLPATSGPSAAGGVSSDEMPQ